MDKLKAGKASLFVLSFRTFGEFADANQTNQPTHPPTPTHPTPQAPRKPLQSPRPYRATQPCKSFMHQAMILAQLVPKRLAMPWLPIQRCSGCALAMTSLATPRCEHWSRVA